MVGIFDLESVCVCVCMRESAISWGEVEGRELASPLSPQDFLWGEGFGISMEGLP